MRRLFAALGFIICTTTVGAASQSGKPYVRPSKEEFRKKLTPEQYSCTQEDGTEKPFANAYWNHKEVGIYVDVISGEPLFSSLDKYDSGSGWPSFTRPIEDSSLTMRLDRKLGTSRTEVRSKQADSHLGHVFDDGPGPSGKRYCINSASLRFIPVAKLKAEGYGRFLFLFAAKKGWQIATLAGGCFWGMEEILRKLPGVIETQVGFTGGTKQNVTYEQVSSGFTGHAEAVQVLFDPKKLTYEKLLLTFFRMHDPTTLNRQGNDVGSQYRSAIFFHDEKQKATAEAVLGRVEKSKKWKKPIVTQVTPASSFWRAEEKHQRYLEAKPEGYTCHFLRDFNFD